MNANQLARPASAVGSPTIASGGLPGSGGGPRSAPGTGPHSAPHLHSTDEVPEICAIARGTVQAAIEVLAGTRPAVQLSRRLEPRCLAALQHRAALTRRLLAGKSPAAGRLHRNPAVRTVRACEVADGVYEASAVVVDELRVRAVALRLERGTLAWRVTELEIG